MVFAVKAVICHTAALAAKAVTDVLVVIVTEAVIAVKTGEL